MKWIRHLMILASAALLPAQAEEWTSPHPLEWESAAPLLPFPKQYHAAPLPAQPLPGREEWELRADPAARAAVSVAWQALLDSLPAEPCGRAMVCKLRLGAEAADSLPETARAEGYVLRVQPGEVCLSAASGAGLFYGMQTLRQLVAGGRSLPVADIADYPAFPVRGFHQDCGRNFQSIESLKRQIDIASQLKLNYFHWHLSDDPAFHLQSRRYPQLNAPEHRTRDALDTYSYAQVRELISYAKARHVSIIPEIDMPGHSEYFVRAFGFEMHTEQGMEVLEGLIDEFCAEVPAADCPIFHFGADEVSVPNAHEFVQRMSRKLAALGRIPMQWEGPWDLPVGELSIAQRWVQGKSSQEADSIKQRTIDSSIGYSNLLDPALLVRRWFFMQPCGVPRGDALRLGSIFCTWPDRRVVDKSLIPLQSSQWPGMCAMAERSWVGGSSRGADAFPTDMPPPESEASRAFRSFEQRMAHLRHSVFRGEHFPYWAEGARENLVVGPVPLEQVEAVRAKVLAGDWSGLPVRRAYGASLYFHTSPGAWNLGMFSQVPPGHCVWVISRLCAPAAGQYPFMLGFDAPLRSHQYYSGQPSGRAWSCCGTRIWLNGEEIFAAHPEPPSGAGEDRRILAEDGELPLRNEEIWWTQPAHLLPLRQGENSLIIEQPYISQIQSWGTSVIPWVE